MSESGDQAEQEKPELFVKRITLEANLEKLAGKIQSAQWDQGNDMEGAHYSAESLRWYLGLESTYFFVCFIGSELAGMVSAQRQPRPYGQEHALYIDELDTAVNYRRLGVASALMEAVKALALEIDSEELWLGTEKSNFAAQKLYESLSPDLIEEFVGYTWELED